MSAPKPLRANDDLWHRLLTALVERDEDTRQSAVAFALEYREEHPQASDDKLLQVAETRARNIVAERRKASSRERANAAAVESLSTSAGTPWRSARQLRRLGPDRALALCLRLQREQRHLGSLLASGAILRDPRLERNARVGAAERKAAKQARRAPGDTTSEEPGGEQP